MDLPKSEIIDFVPVSPCRILHVNIRYFDSGLAIGKSGDISWYYYPVISL